VSSRDTASPRPLPWRLLTSFGRFWWDFLVGDTPEITVAVIVIVGAVALLRDVAHVNSLAYVTLIVLSVAALALSAARARRKPQ
jgi:hypothetical protein